MVVTADLYDTHAAHVTSCMLQFQQFGAITSFAGRIRTVRCVNDNMLIKQTLQEDANGEVLVVDAGGYLGAAVMGDNIAKLAHQHGWSGVVINGAIRDAKTIQGIPLGIKALGTNPQKTSKKGEGWVDIPVSFGNVCFVPGHYLYSDEDGILVSETALS
ncbi:ribonuclease E activity regulator RraA [Billgrantia sp. LNSP4103-1]|uniref:ribonuclease E activity regulator RraA n=1 Tax=Billgrantia sp. LNSP4103-1 TaxID=3410266 RepID=UPI00403F4E57